MNKRRSPTEQRREHHATAKAKVQMWTGRAVKARQDGRTAHAQRCDDKVRDWASRARQLEQTQETPE